MYFNVCILIDIEPTKTHGQLADRAYAILDKFDHNREILEYKRRLDSDEFNRMSKHYETTDLNELADKLLDWDGEDGAVDEKGLFALSTQNPDGKFDRGDVIDLIPYDQWEHVFLSGREGLVCRAVITPDGEWHDEWDLMEQGLAGEERLDVWTQQVKTLFEQHQSATAVLASLHT